MSLRQILTVDQMRAAEQALIDAKDGQGESVESLMERAGAGAADYVFRMAAGRPVTVLCGPGNNGGDGYVIARVLSERGVPVQVIAPLEPATDAARTARAKWGGTPVEDAHGAVFVDCLFGSGLTRGLSSELETLLLHLAASHDLRVAVDLPSGVESDSGELLNANLPVYDLVIALGAWKYAHWTMPGMALMCEKRLFDIGVAQVPAAAHLAERLGLSSPAMNAHKYTRGLLGVIGGEMPGAARLAARAAQHGGAGYVKLITNDGLPVADDLVLVSGALDEALGDVRLAALLIGPGLGRSNSACAYLIAAVNFERNLVLDGDALMLLEPEMLADRTGELLLTPHEGELKRLCEVFGIAAGTKRERAIALAAATRATIVAKGADTIIVDPFEGVVIAPPASTWLSTAGTGDVLAGLIASRLATGENPLKGATEGCALHAEAARLAGPVFSASDLIDAIPAAYASFL